MSSWSKNDLDVPTRVSLPYQRIPPLPGPQDYMPTKDYCLYFFYSEMVASVEGWFDRLTMSGIFILRGCRDKSGHDRLF